MQAVILTKQELNDLLVGMINTLSSAKNQKYEEYLEDYSGLVYGNPTPKKEWEKNQKKYISRINKLRKKIGEEYLN